VWNTGNLYSGVSAGHVTGTWNACLLCVKIGLYIEALIMLEYTHGVSTGRVTHLWNYWLYFKHLHRSASTCIVGVNRESSTQLHITVVYIRIAIPYSLVLGLYWRVPPSHIAGAVICDFCFKFWNYASRYVLWYKERDNQMCCDIKREIIKCAVI
jgi:hypothetical protein